MSSKVLRGRVARHLGRGRKLGYPTANLDASTDLEEGIYLGIVTKIKGGKLPPLLLRKLLARKDTPPNPPFQGGKKTGLPALVFIGEAKTFQERQKLIEVHILDFHYDIYETAMEAEVIKKIRDNQKFNSAEELVDQMKKDELVARQFFSSYNMNN